MSTNNDSSPFLSVPVVRNATGVDKAATLAECGKLCDQYAEDDKAASAAVIEATNKILTNDKWKKMTSITPGVLAKMALGLMGEMPTDKICAETEVRVKSYLQGQSEKFLYIARGRNAGFHFKARLSKDELAKLVKEQATAASAAAAKAAGETAEAAE